MAQAIFEYQHKAFDTAQTTTAPLFLEPDMEDMFWEIPENEIHTALDWAIGIVKGSRNNL